MVTPARSLVALGGGANINIIYHIMRLSEVPVVETCGMAFNTYLFIVHISGYEY